MLKTVEILCCNRRRSDGWKFPKKVEELLLGVCKQKSVLHLFGGRSSFGTRIDIDPITKPDVIADAWLPPFAPDCFDIVVLDPPYVKFNMQTRHSLLTTATAIAREHVIWFSTIWIDHDCRLKMERAWLVQVGDNCHVRCLQIFRVPTVKRPMPTRFTRGPAIKYNRWLAQPQGLEFPPYATV